MLSYIKSLDQFGHPITLNVKQSKGAPFKTHLGGIASALIKVTLIIILFHSFYLMLNSQNQTIKSREKLKSNIEMEEKV